MSVAFYAMSGLCKKVVWEAKIRAKRERLTPLLGRHGGRDFCREKVVRRSEYLSCLRASADCREVDQGIW